MFPEFTLLGQEEVIWSSILVLSLEDLFGDIQNSISIES